MRKVLSANRLGEDVADLLTLDFARLMAELVVLDKHATNHRDEVPAAILAEIQRAVAEATDAIRMVECSFCEDRIGLFQRRHGLACSVCDPLWIPCASCGDDVKRQDAVVLEDGSGYHPACNPVGE